MLVTTITGLNLPDMEILLPENIEDSRLMVSQVKKKGTRRSHDSFSPSIQPFYLNDWLSILQRPLNWVSSHHHLPASWPGKLHQILQNALRHPAS